MDGNGRWATGRGLSRILGHRAGMEAARRVVEAAPAAGIGILTLFAFSSDNWRRPTAGSGCADAPHEGLPGERNRALRCRRACGWR